jgi:predicted Zn-dependent protease
MRLLLAWFEQRAGRHEVALSLYRSVNEQGASTASTMALAYAYADSGNVNEGIATLRQWVEQHPGDKRASIGLAQLQTNAGRPDAAAETLSRLLTYRPKDVGLMNDIALLMRREAPAKALALAQRANELAPEQSAIMDTFAVLLLDAGRAPESVQLLTRALSQEPENATIRLHLAQALLADGALVRARVELENLLARYPEAPEREAAEALLARLSVQ